MELLVKILIVYFIVVNLVAMCMYWVDKRKAIKNKWRIPEKTLILVAAIGGSIGALLGMYLFRHKTKHKKFTIGVPAILITQVIVAVCLVIVL